MMLVAAKVKHFWRSLDKKVVVNQRELVLGVTVCALAGIVTGMFLSPKKELVIGSHNGNNNSGSISAPEEDEKEAEE